MMARLLLIVLAGLGLATSALAQADPYAAQMDRAKQLRVAGDLNGAQQIVDTVLIKSPGHFCASYTQGLIQLDRGRAQEGVKTLSATVRALNGKPAPDPTIYNTLGWAQMRLGQYDAAEASFKLGYQEQARLPAASRQKLLNNMGLLYRLKGQEPAARQYVQEAAKAGSPQAQVTLKQMKAQ